MIRSSIFTNKWLVWDTDYHMLLERLILTIEWIRPPYLIDIHNLHVFTARFQKDFTTVMTSPLLHL